MRYRQINNLVRVNKYTLVCAGFKMYPAVFKPAAVIVSNGNLLAGTGGTEITVNRWQKPRLNKNLKAVADA